MGEGMAYGGTLCWWPFVDTGCPVWMLAVIVEYDMTDTLWFYVPAVTPIPPPHPHHLPNPQPPTPT